jgi:hypothetical protein
MREPGLMDQDQDDARALELSDARAEERKARQGKNAFGSSGLKPYGVNEKGEEVNQLANDRAGALNEARHAKRENEKQGKIGTVVNKRLSYVSTGPSWLLRWAWISLIPGFGLTGLLINIHVFASWAVNNTIFVPLGQEWMPPASKKATENISKPLGMIEKGGLAMINFGCLLVVLVVFCVIMVVGDWWELIKMGADALLTKMRGS